MDFTTYRGGGKQTKKNLPRKKDQKHYKKKKQKKKNDDGTIILRKRTRFLIERLRKQLSDGREEENEHLREYVRKTFPPNIVREIFSAVGGCSPSSTATLSTTTATASTSNDDEEIDVLTSKLIPGLDIHQKKEMEEEEEENDQDNNDNNEIIMSEA